MPAYGLLDLNNAYVSMESVFRPELWDKVVVVASNNDGCVVSRSAAAKAAGIKMGVPIHELRKQRGLDVIVLSSNYEHYSAMSSRVVQIVAEVAPSYEIYSIDELFLETDRMAGRVQFGRDLRERVRKWVGLPSCIGFANGSKTLAKLANHVAKKRPEYDGVFDLDERDAAARERLLGEIEVGEVWGVGRRIAPRLEALGIRTVRDLRDANPADIRRQFSVVLERTVRELRGESCLPLELVQPKQKQVMCSRSFGAEAHSFDELRQAVLTYASRGSEKLRAQGLMAGMITVFIRTNPFKPNRPQYGGSLTLPLPDATSDTLTIGQFATRALRQIYRDGYGYKKAGVLLSELTPVEFRQARLLEDPALLARRARLNQALDAVNARFGRGSLALAGAGIEKPWRMRREHLTPHYTTRWEDLPIVK